MSTFTVPIVSVVIEPHDNADALEIARVGDYRSVVPKGEFKSGELVAYIPEQALLPAPLLQSMGLTGKLAGSDHNRVKAIRLRGVLSQGLVLRARPEWSVGDNVATSGSFLLGGRRPRSVLTSRAWSRVLEKRCDPAAPNAAVRRRSKRPQHRRAAGRRCAGHRR